jgi:hypothetical protein
MWVEEHWNVLFASDGSGIHTPSLSFEVCLHPMNVSNPEKVQIVAAVLQSPMMVEILKTIPPQKWDQPNEIGAIVASVAGAVMQACTKL